MAEIQTKDLEVKIAVDNILLGWLSKVTNLSVKDVLFALYDISTISRDRLISRNGYWSSSKANFPDTDIKMKIHASRHYDEKMFREDKSKYQDRCFAETGFHPWHWESNAWKASNIEPNYHSVKYHSIKVTFSLANTEKETVVSQQDIETMMTEKFLLGCDDE